MFSAYKKECVSTRYTDTCRNSHAMLKILMDNSLQDLYKTNTQHKTSKKNIPMSLHLYVNKTIKDSLKTWVTTAVWNQNGS